MKNLTKHFTFFTKNKDKDDIVSFEQHEIKEIIKKIINLQYRIEYNTINFNPSTLCNKLRLSHIEINLAINNKPKYFYNIPSEIYKEFESYYLIKNNDENNEKLLYKKILKIENNKATGKTKDVILFLVKSLLCRYSVNIILDSILEYKLNLTKDIKFIITKCQYIHNLASQVRINYENYINDVNNINDDKVKLLEKLNNNIDLLPNKLLFFNYYDNNAYKQNDYDVLYSRLKNDICKTLEERNKGLA